MVRTALILALLTLAGCSTASRPVCRCADVIQLKEQVADLKTEVEDIGDEQQVQSIDGAFRWARLQEQEAAIEMHNARIAEIEKYVPQELKELRMPEVEEDE